MAKSAIQKFEEYRAEYAETQDALNEMIKASYDVHGSHSYAAGYLQSVAAELIMQLPKAKRAEYRNQLFGQALKDKQTHLMKTMKETV